LYSPAFLLLRRAWAYFERIAAMVIETVPRA
jgi:hypothetical protein